MVNIKEAVAALKEIPSGHETLMIRTYFGPESSDAAVEKLFEEHTAPDPKEGFQAHLTLVNDPRCEGLTRDILLQSEFDDTAVYTDGFAFLADEQSFKDKTLLCINLAKNTEDMYTYPPEQMHYTEYFRIIPTETWGPQNNIQIANMDFSEFGEACDEDGVFRGFPEPDRPYIPPEEQPPPKRLGGDPENAMEAKVDTTESAEEEPPKKTAEDG